MDIRDRILSELKKQGRTITWLSDKSKIPYGKLYRRLVFKLPLMEVGYVKSIFKVLSVDITINDKIKGIKHGKKKEK